MRLEPQPHRQSDGRLARPRKCSLSRLMGLFIACAAIVQFAALSIFHGSPAAGIWARREVQELLMQQNGIILNSTHPPQSASSQQIPAAPSHNKTIRNRLVTTIRNFGGLGNNEDDRGNRAAAHPVPAAALPASSRSGPGSESGAPAALAPALGLHTFYYAWYGTPEVDGKWLHWDHEVLKHWGGPAVNSKYPTVGSRHSPPERIGSNYYPSAGPYSSRNESIIQQHVGMMADAGIGVLVYSWWGRGLGDANGDPTDTAIIANVFKHCLARNVKVSFHLEPYQGRSALSVRADILHLIDAYGSHPALYKIKNKPVFYIYDSYLTPPAEWFSVLGPRGKGSSGNSETVRGTKYDSVVLGLWVEVGHGSDLLRGGFDGSYTYFATDGMTYGSSHAHWPSMQELMRQNKMLFIPSIGPGYMDTSIRPWNTDNTRHRAAGAYYASSWEHAATLNPDAISLTSFNEWHEGTQLEPAASMQRMLAPTRAAHINQLDYVDYEPLSPDFYLEATRREVEACRKRLDMWCHAANA